MREREEKKVSLKNFQFKTLSSFNSDESFSINFHFEWFVGIVDCGTITKQITCFQHSQQTHTHTQTVNYALASSFKWKLLILNRKKSLMKHEKHYFNSLFTGDGPRLNNGAGKV